MRHRLATPLACTAIAFVGVACAQERTIVGYGTPPADTSATEAPRPDYSGARLAFTIVAGGRAQLAVSAADGSAMRVLPIADTIAPELGIAWSPDGNRLLYTRRAARGASIAVRVFDLRTGEVGFLTPQLAGGQQPTWSPTGARVAYVVPMRGDLSTVRVTEVGRTMDSLLVSDAREPAWGSDARVAYSGRPPGQPTGEYAILVRDMAGGADVRVSPDDGAAYGFPAWSADGRLAMIRRGGSPATWSLVVMRPSEPGARTLLTSDQRMLWPAWSPDGRTLALAWESGGTLGLWTVLDDGSELQPLTAGDGAMRNAPRWRPGVR